MPNSATGARAKCVCGFTRALVVMGFAGLAPLALGRRFQMCPLVRHCPSDHLAYAHRLSARTSRSLNVADLPVRGCKGRMNGACAAGGVAHGRVNTCLRYAQAA